MVLAVGRSRPVLISRVRFLDTGMKRMTRFVKGIGDGHHIIIIKELFFFFLSHWDWAGYICIAGIFYGGQRFPGVIPTLLDLQWDLRNFYPGGFF